MQSSNQQADQEMNPRLVSELRAVLGHSDATAADLIRQARALLNSAPYRGGLRNSQIFMTGSRPLQRGGLAPWQVRCVKQYIEEALADRLTGANLARRVRLSEHHFYRAFRVSLHMTPHTYVIGRRIARACDLMLSCHLSIGQIATECGFADQAHLNRCFRKLMGSSPGAWRRSQSGTRLTAARHLRSIRAESTA